VTIQAQILDLLLQAPGRARHGADADHPRHGRGGRDGGAGGRPVCRPAGREAAGGALFADPHHPYTAALLDALPERAAADRRLPTIPGVVPGQYDRPTGCLFIPRCRFAEARCTREAPPLDADRDGAVPLLLRRAFPWITRRRRQRRAGADRRRPRPHYRVSRGVFAASATLKALDGVSFRVATGRDAGGGRRVRLRQIDAGPPGDA
jgi:oligopeptide/dipeptide ABC transporter ATP-binding protein